VEAQSADNYELESWATRALVMPAMFFQGQAQQLFDHLICAETMLKFTDAAAHCEMGARWRFWNRCRLVSGTAAERPRRQAKSAQTIPPLKPALRDSRRSLAAHVHRRRIFALIGKAAQEPTTMPWGNRSLLSRDPDGNLVNFFIPVSDNAIKKFARGA
jgi:hypothetical protein